MKKLIFGVTLAIIGILMLVFKEFGYATTEKIAGLGLIVISKEINYPIQWSSVVGISLMALGGLFVFSHSRKRNLLWIARD